MKLAKLTRNQIDREYKKNLEFIKLNLSEKFNHDYEYLNELINNIIENCNADLPEILSLAIFSLENNFNNDYISKTLRLLNWKINYKTIEITISIIKYCHDMESK